MNKTDTLKKQKNIFGKLLLLSNKLQATGNKLLTGEVTTRQWLLTSAIARFGDTSPILSEVARIMDSSHQNVKQLALKLEKRGFLIIEKDSRDLRSIRLKLTEKSCVLWQKQQEEIKSYLNRLFGEFSMEEIDSLYYCLNKLYDGILKAQKSSIERESGP